MKNHLSISLAVLWHVLIPKPPRSPGGASVRVFFFLVARVFLKRTRGHPGPTCGENVSIWGLHLRYHKKGMKTNNWLVVSSPLKNMKVSWDHYSQYMEKNVPNHQPACVKFRKAKKESDYWELSMLYMQLCKLWRFRNTMSAACNWWLTCHEYLRNSMKFCNWVEKVAWHHQV